MTKKPIKEIFHSALEAVNPYLVVEGYADKIRSEYMNGGFKQLLVIGFGKSSYQMAKSIEESIGTDLISGGIIITKYGHGINQESEAKKLTRHSPLKIYEAGHPIPDISGYMATEEIINFLKNADKKTLVLCLISGGGSALFVSPCNGIKLNEKQRITELLLKAGANIDELNAVRKHISKVKGGRLSEIVYPAKIMSLILSDVIGDKLDVIASGPTAPDNSTFQDALNVIDKFNLPDKTPEIIMDTLNRGREGFVAETPKHNSPVFDSVQNVIIGNNLRALDAAKIKAQSLGFETNVISSEIAGEARSVGKWLAEKAIKTRKALSAKRNEKKICLVSGGETTVTVRGSGKGGRNMELALSFAKEIEGIEGIIFLSAGTDGTDGPTDAAGAIVDWTTMAKAKSLSLSPDEFLENNDSYNFFKAIDALLITGPTGTNVMDVQIILIE